MLAADLLGAMRKHVAIEAEAIGGARLEAAGARIVVRTRGWASLGPLAAAGKIPRLWTAMARTALALRADPPDVVVLVDFGAFNLRFAKTLRLLGFTRPIVYYAPPAAWLDNAKRARQVARLTDALTIFAHQAGFYRGLGLPIAFSGHPLVSRIVPRPPRPPAPPDGGHIALLPGSRSGEIARHVPRLLDALALLRETRPAIEATIVAADDDARALVEHLLQMRKPLPLAIVSSAGSGEAARGVLAQADAAIIASGTAVLEAALIGTPTVALYVLAEAQAKMARRIYHGAYVTLPNLVLGEALVPELLQSAAEADALAAETAALLDEPERQRDGYARLRAALGPPDALDRIASWVLAAAAERR